MTVTLVSVFSELRAIGLRILSACLKREGHHVQLVFLPRLHRT